MNKTNRSKGARPPSLLALLPSALPLAPAIAQTGTGQGPAYSVVDQGAFYRVWQSTGPVTNAATGQVLPRLASYTELGDGLNFLDAASGQWTPAQDVISLTPTGAAATQGQITAAFGGDITAPGAIALTTASGLAFQSHPLGLYYYDSASGLVAQIGSVQPSTGLLYAPNVLVFTNVLSGLNADLMLVWAKEGFEQCLVLKQAPPAPASLGLSAASSRLQLWTAMDACPQPARQQAVRLRTGLVDNRLFYPDCWFPVGSAFAFGETPLPPAGQAARVRQFDPVDPNAIPTAKSLVTIAGQQVLIEEINYTDLAAAFANLSHAALPPARRQAVQLASRGQLLPAPAGAQRQSRPIQAASGPYQASGVLLDYITLTGTSNAFTFTNGATYWVSNNFTVGSGGATFQSGSVVKFATNAYLNLNGPVQTPTTGAAAVLTSMDDNSVGAQIRNSTGKPNYAAHYAIIMDYNDLPGMLLENLAICWAQYGIDWEEDPGYDGNVSYCTFENCLNAIWLDMYDDILTLWDDVCCNVSNQVYVQSGAFSGTMGNCALLYWASPGLMPTALRGTNASGGGSVTQEVDIACTNFLPTDTTVYYTISGTASNGGDYQTLTGSVLVPATGSGGGSVFIQPIYRTNLGFDPIVVLTLVPANGYQIISNLASVSVPIMDHFSSNIFTVVASPNQAVDVDYSTVSTSLVVSVNYPNGLPENFALLGTNGIPARWSGVSGLPNNSVGGGEVNLATIKAAGNTNFKVGDVYFIGEGTGSIGVGIEQRKLLQHELAHTVQRDGPRRGFRPLPGPDRRVGVQPASGDEPSGDQPERCLEDRRANELYPARVQPPCREHGGAADRAPRHQLRSVGR